nr:lysosomal protein NCU G1 B [Hymenolepis microstoma]
MCGRILVLLVIFCVGNTVWSKDFQVSQNPECDSDCQEEFPNLVHVSAKHRNFSMHFFTAASAKLGAPSIFMVKSAKQNAGVAFDWKKLFASNMYDGIRIEEATDIYGISYLSIFDFRDPSGNSDMVTASKNNKTYQEYYLTQFDYSLVKADPTPDPETGLIEIRYRSEPQRRHRLLKDGGHIEVKILIPTKDDEINRLQGGLSFKSIISFHGLTILHPDSKLGVGVALFSNVSLSPSSDFLEGKYLDDFNGPGSNRDFYVHLNEENSGSFDFVKPFEFPSSKSTPKPVSQTLVLFRAGANGQLEDKTESVPINPGPRLLLRSNQKSRLSRSLAKAIYGRRVDQNFQPTRNISRKVLTPIGIRLQHFAFAAPGQLSAKYASWNVTLTMDFQQDEPEKYLCVEQARNNQEITGMRIWGLFLMKWLASFHPV